MRKKFKCYSFFVGLLVSSCLNAENLVSEYDVISEMPEETLQEFYGDSLLENDRVFYQETTILPPTQSKSTPQEATIMGFGDPGTSYSISVNTAYSNAFSGAATNHYYQFSISGIKKLTGRNWNIPAATNLDMALYEWSTSSSQWTLVAFSQVSGATDEQLSYIASSGDYMLEIAMTGAPNTNTYNLSVTTQATYDAQEADDNYWQAQDQTSFHQVIGTLDNNYDKDFIKFTNSQTESVKYSIIGGDYTAELRNSSGALAYTLSANSLVSLSVPAGTWYWVISSPSHSVNPSANYTFNQQTQIERLELRFQSDEQTGYSQRVNWGAGKYSPLHESATIAGQAIDGSGNPVGNTTLKILFKSSINDSFDYTFYTTTDVNGDFSKTISSPTGAGSNTFGGAGLTYAFDVHSIFIYMYDPTGVSTTISSIVQTDDIDTLTTTNSAIKVNDVAYYY